MKKVKKGKKIMKKSPYLGKKGGKVATPPKPTKHSK
jgi:hypothetical protein